MTKTFALLGLLLLATSIFAQTVSRENSIPTVVAVTAKPDQSALTTLGTLPAADVLIYISPQRILNDAAPKVIAADELTKMRASFADIKKSAGVDPSSIDSLVIAVRFHKPSGELNFTPPDVMAVVSGDFSADSLLTLARLYLQDRARDEKYGSKTITVIQIDPIAAAAEKNAILKPFTHVGVVALNVNTIAIGNVSYIESAIDAAAGNGRITEAALSSLLRDPNALMSAAGSPLTAFNKSFGLLGTETTPRDSRCDTRFGDFYGAVTTEASNFNLRGAMNADNPDSAKIINGLLSGLLQQAITAVPDKNAQSMLKGLRMAAKESEVVIEADIPQHMVADLIREQMAPKPAPASAPPKKTIRKRRRIRH